MSYFPSVASKAHCLRSVPGVFRVEVDKKKVTMHATLNPCLYQQRRNAPRANPTRPPADPPQCNSPTRLSRPHVGDWEICSKQIKQISSRSLSLSSAAGCQRGSLSAAVCSPKPRIHRSIGEAGTPASARPITPSLAPHFKAGTTGLLSFSAVVMPTTSHARQD